MRSPGFTSLRRTIDYGCSWPALSVKRLGFRLFNVLQISGIQVKSLQSTNLLLVCHLIPLGLGNPVGYRLGFKEQDVGIHATYIL